MTICAACGHDVSGKKFCPACGTPVQSQISQAVSCPHCQGEVKLGAAFCMHCGTALNASTPAMRTCPACHMQVAGTSAFCTNCGQDMHAPVAQSATICCARCSSLNPAGTRFCSGCGTQLATDVPIPTGYASSSQYPQYAQNMQQPGQAYQQSYAQPQYPQSPYQQGQYQQPQYPQYPQTYGQPQYSQSPYQQGQYQPGQNAYQPQSMMGQGPMVLRCPTCMAIAPLGSTHCVSCRTSLVGVAPMPANMPMQGQQGGFLQGNGGKLAMGALGGAAAVLGGEMLLHGVERSIEDRVEDNIGFGGHHRNEGLLGELGELADDVGL